MPGELLAKAILSTFCWMSQHYLYVNLPTKTNNKIKSQPIINKNAISQYLIANWSANCLQNKHATI
jgi:hypothetical protein